MKEGALRASFQEKSDRVRDVKCVRKASSVGGVFWKGDDRWSFKKVLDGATDVWPLWEQSFGKAAERCLCIQNNEDIQCSVYMSLDMEAAVAFGYDCIFEGFDEGKGSVADSAVF